MISNWMLFLAERADVSKDYQLDDIVYTGRMAFLRAVDGDSQLLSEHAGISQVWAAAAYEDEKTITPKAVLERLHKR